MIDTHAHIYSNKFDNDRQLMLQNAFESGISHIVMPNIDSDSIEPMLQLERDYPGKCWATMGLHPCSVDEQFEKQLQFIEDWLGQRPFVAIGEMGLDLYWDKTFFAQQQESFRIHAGWAKQYDLPLIIHTRECMAETISLIEELQDGQLKGVVHCFTGSRQDAERILAQGFYLGLGGVSTFPKAGLDQVIPYIPLDRILLETDSPYLAPVPHRGKRNEPAYLTYISAKIAELHGLTLPQLESITDSNATRFFGLPNHKADQ